MSVQTSESPGNAGEINIWNILIILTDSKMTAMDALINT